jgi:hypothetical protein
MPTYPQRRLAMNTLSNTVPNPHDNGAASAGPILAIDLGKYKSVACIG